MFLAAEVTTSGTALDDPSVLSDLKTFQQAAPTPTQAAVIGVSSVLLTLLIGYPGFLLSRVLVNRYEQLFAWTRRLPKLSVKQPGWALWLGIATAAVAIAGTATLPLAGAGAGDAQASVGQIPGDFLRWVLIFVAFALVSVVAWLIDRRASRVPLTHG